MQQILGIFFALLEAEVYARSPGKKFVLLARNPCFKKSFPKL